MKNKIIVIAVFLFVFSINSFAQITVKVTPKKVKYTRPGKDVSEYKKTFEITYPIITGKTPTSSIEESLSYWKNFETTLAEIKDETFTSEMSYKVNYNGKGILDIQLIHSGSAAYPSDFVKNLIIELDSGKSVKIKDAFQNRNKLYEMIAKAQKIEIQNEIAKEKEESLRELTKESATYYSIYEIEDFSVSDKGVTFLFDYNFNHATLALQPEGRYFFTWAELKPFVNEYGPLGYFVRKSK